MRLEDRVVQYASSGDIHIAYSVIGDGPVDLIWVTGNASHLDYLWDVPLFAHMAERLAAFSRLILFDQRGAGLSDPVPLHALPTLEERMDDIRAVLDAARSERAVLLGDLFGGPTCMLFASTLPQRVSSLVLYGTAARYLRDRDYPAGMPAATYAQTGREFSRSWGTGASLSWFVPSLPQDEDFRRVIAKGERAGASPAALVALWEMWGGTDVRDILSSIRVPTLVIHRTGDQVFRVGHGRYLAENIPGAQYVEFPGIDHFWVGEAVELIGGEIEEFVTGKRTAVAADRVLATVLFTDIVGSTAKASEIGDHAWRELLDRHDDGVRRQLERYRGGAFKNTGDGVAATFDGPARAINCACAIRDAVRGMGLEVRAGLHTGEIERRGDDVSGVGVHIAARVAGLAGPGEVLVSSTVKDLVVGSGINFEDRGTHALKGVPDEWRLLSVVG
ncbi:MAG: adenylate/guanylate cyclase domain-containing protein [Candidatus Dormiibacterota bacterium]